VQRRTADLRRALEEMSAAQKRTHEAYLDTIYRLAMVAELQRPIHWLSHCADEPYRAILAGALKLPPEEVEIIRAASPMHDVGKIGIPDVILLKPADSLPRNGSHEAAYQHRRPDFSGSNSEVMHAGEIIALSHHEKWDGAAIRMVGVGKNPPLGPDLAVADALRCHH